MVKALILESIPGMLNIFKEICLVTITDFTNKLEFRAGVKKFMKPYIRVFKIGIIINSMLLVLLLALIWVTP